MRSSIKLFSIASIGIHIHFTWLIILAIMTVSIATGVFRPQYPEWNIALPWLAGFLAAILIFTSVLVHELSHAFMAKRNGIGVKNITLFLFGGVSNLERDANTASSEFSIAIVGPITSGIIGGICLLVNIFFVSSETFLGGLLRIVGGANLAIAAFNLLPGFPLDGGRVLRAIVWGSTRDMHRATNVAATTGQFFGWGLIIGGIIWAFPLGEVFSGVWLAFIGWFLLSAASSTKQDAVLQRTLRGTLVSRVMIPDIRPVDPRMTLDMLVETRMLRTGEKTMIVSRNDELLGIVSLTDIGKVPRALWSRTSVEDVMSSEVQTVEPSDELTDVLRIMADVDINQLPVVSHGRIVGIIDRVRFMHYIHTSQQLGIR